MDEHRNSFGIYDEPFPWQEKEKITLTRDELERQLDAGAFFMDHDEAARLGFLHPDHEPDNVIVDIQEKP